MNWLSHARTQTTAFQMDDREGKEGHVSRTGSSIFLLLFREKKNEEEWKEECSELVKHQRSTEWATGRLVLLDKSKALLASETDNAPTLLPPHFISLPTIWPIMDANRSGAASAFHCHWR